MSRAPLRIKSVLLTTLVLAVVVWVNAGNLNPPSGPVSPTMKSLDQIEPRTPITSLPFSITSPGSYYLTKDLTGSTGQNGITINANDVSLDLCGFTVRGTNGSLNGIHVSGQHSKIRIENGTVTGWGQDGVNTQSADKTTIMMMMARDNDGNGVCTNGDSTVLYMSSNFNLGDGLVCGDRCICVDAEVCGNAGKGIRTGSGCKVEDCVASSNGSDGLSVGEGSVVAVCTTNGNGGTGLVASSGPTSRGSNILNCIAILNTLNGIAAAPGSTISTCTGQNNGVDGIQAGTGCTITGCTVRGNTGDGIEAAGACLVLENNASANGTGIRVFSTSGGGTRVDSNNAAFNATLNFDISSAGNLTIRNSSSGPGTGYSFAAGNDFGPVITLSGGGPIGSTHPWANFDF